MTDYFSEQCRNLYKQVIRRAIKDLMIKREELAHGRSWMEELICDPEYYLFDSKEEALPSFIGICHIFNCDPDYLRGEIRAYLEEKEIEVGMSALEHLKALFKKEKTIIRNRLNLWGWGKLRVKKAGLDELLNILLADDCIREIAKRTETGKIARYYVWTGK
jgi:hypothetical protein